MKVDKNGVIINTLVSADNSMLGDDFIVMWDEDGLPIHINRKIIDYLYNGTHPKPQQQQQPTNANDAFL